jgi:beta-fructofuranosidase
MVFATQEMWHWDSWYVRDGDLWHGYFLQAPKSLIDPDARHLKATQRHATSRDLVTWTDLGTTFEPQRNAAWDDSTTWTGSVLKGGDGLCLDLTGPEAECCEDRHMVGHWHDRAMRDPWVMKDPHGPGYLMYFTARVPGVPEPNAGGAIGFATSPDLYTWTLRPPVFAGGYGQSVSAKPGTACSAPRRTSGPSRPAARIPNARSPARTT